MDTLGMSDLHRTHEITPRDQTGIRLHIDTSQHNVDRDPIAIVIRIRRLTCGQVELSGASDFHQIVISIGRLGKRVEEVHDRGAIEPRLRCNRAAIVTPSLRNHLHDLQKAINGGLRSRSTIDRGPIASPSWPDRGAIVVLLEAKLKPIQCRIEATMPPNEDRFHDASNPLPRPCQLPTIFGLIFPLKTHVFSLCSSTFHRFVKKLSEFRGRSLVHHDPPAFRLDCEAMGSELTTNFSLISSNFPLEF